MASFKGKIGIIGSGLIGKSWAMLFCGTGYNVYLYDISDELVKASITSIHSSLDEYESNGSLKGTLSAIEQKGLITGGSSLKDCLQGCIYIQENVPEDLKLKIKVFEEIDALVQADTIIASSTSCIVPSKFTGCLKHRENCVVAHPVYPPDAVPLVEIVPAPWTSKTTVETTKRLMTEIGQSPVTLKKECPGFALNRLQYHLLNECINMVDDGILSVEDADKTMVNGLAPRYLWDGPLVTAHLNADGMADYCKKYGPTIRGVSASFKEPPSWTVDGTAEVTRQLNELVPLDKLPEARDRRVKRIKATSRCKRSILEEEK